MRWSAAVSELINKTTCDQKVVDWWEKSPAERRNLESRQRGSVLLWAAGRWLLLLLLWLGAF